MKIETSSAFMKYNNIKFKTPMQSIIVKHTIKHV